MKKFNQFTGTFINVQRKKPNPMQSEPSLFDVPLSRSIDVSTSKDAEIKFKNSGAHKRDIDLVFECFLDNKELTWKDIDKLTDVTHPWKRVSDLKALGKIEAVGKRDGCTLYRKIVK